MTVLKYLSPVLLGLIALVPFIINHFFISKESLWYKRIRNTFIPIVVLGVILNLSLIHNNENTIASLENQNNMLSILYRMQKYITTDYDTLNKKYPKGYFLFASNKYTVIPSNDEIKSTFNLDWNSSIVRHLDNSFICINLRHYYNLQNHIELENLYIVLERKVGAIADGIVINNVGLFVELLDDRPDDIIYVIGFKEVESIPKERNLDPKVQGFIKKIGIPAAKSGIDTNTKQYIKIIDWTICSGWKITKI